MAANLTLIPDHLERAIANMLSQFGESVNLETLLRIIIPEVQELENAIYSLWAERTLETAAGAQQDQYGKVVGQPRNGLDDDTYKRFLKVRILSNRSNARINPILDIVELAMETTTPVRYTLLHPASYQIEYSLSDPSDPVLQAILLDVLLDATAAGVKLTHVTETTQLTGYFGFEEDPDALGFDDGELATEIL